MRFVVDKLETNCKNCILRDFNFSIQGPICSILKCKLKVDENGNERPEVGIDKCHDNFITFDEAMKEYAKEESDKLVKLADKVKSVDDYQKQDDIDKKIDLVEDDGFLGKVKTNDEIINSTQEERELVTIGEELRSYKNKYYPEKK